MALLPLCLPEAARLSKGAADALFSLSKALFVLLPLVVVFFV
jgi:hypothetical protein